LPGCRSELPCHRQHRLFDGLQDCGRGGEVCCDSLAYYVLGVEIMFNMYDRTPKAKTAQHAAAQNKTFLVCNDCPAPSTLEQILFLMESRSESTISPVRDTDPQGIPAFRAF
jgi:hypothetical protein